MAGKKAVPPQVWQLAEWTAAEMVSAMVGLWDGGRTVRWAEKKAAWMVDGSVWQ